MSGICGYLSFNHDNYASPETIRRMSDALIHRGPKYGHFEDRGLGVGFRGSNVIDPLEEHQPVTNGDGTLVLVFDGEVYNLKEIGRSLGERHPSRSRSGAQVLLHLYEEKHHRMLHELNGRFSFAIWDKKNEILFCARDRVGQKPFYYALTSGSFIFASEPKAILRFSRDLGEVDLRALTKYLAYDYVPPPNTLFEGIKQLPAGHCLTVHSSGSVQIQRYWEVSYGFPQEQRLPRADRKEICNNLLRLFRESIRRRLNDDVPLGVFLSGGVDSSSVVSMMREFCDGKDVNTFSVKFEENSFDESEYVDEVVHRFGTRHRRITVTSSDMKDVLPEMVKALDEPFGDPSIVPRFLLSRFARKHVAIVLSGDGGDELFAGYPACLAHKVIRWIELIPSWFIESILARAARCLPVSASNCSPHYLVKRFFQGVGHEPEIMAQLWHGSFSHEKQASLLNEDLGLSLRREDVYDELYDRAIALDTKHELDTVNRILHFYFCFFLHADLAKVDRINAANALEVRAPFLDVDFVEYASSIEPRLKIHGLTTKYIFKMAMRERLPQRILKRQKRGFSVPVGGWFKAGLRDMLTDVLSPQYIREQGLFNPAFVENLIKEHLNGVRDNRKELWSLFMFVLWYEEHCRSASGA